MWLLLNFKYVSSILIFEFEWNCNRGPSLACSKKWVNLIGSEEMSYALDVKNRKMKCLQRCELQTEIATYTSSAFPIKSTFSQHPYFCFTLYKVANICNRSDTKIAFENSPDDYNITCAEILRANKSEKICDESDWPNETPVESNPKLSNFLYQYAKLNLAVLEVFIKDPYYTLIIRDEQLPLIASLGNAGGLLSLCMGISLISFFEIFYHLSNFSLGVIYKILN